MRAAEALASTRREAIRRQSKAILAANGATSKPPKAPSCLRALTDRLVLDDKRVEAMAKGLEDVAALPDPVGRVLADGHGPTA